MKLLIFICLLSLCGYHWPGVDTHEHDKPWPITQQKKEARLALLLHTNAPDTNFVQWPKTNITLGWQSATATTGLIGTTNMRDWYEVTNFFINDPQPDRIVMVTLCNRPFRFEAYRAFNR